MARFTSSTARTTCSRRPAPKRFATFSAASSGFTKRLEMPSRAMIGERAFVGVDRSRRHAAIGASGRRAGGGSGRGGRRSKGVGSGITARQIAVARGQRGRKGQPGGKPGKRRRHAGDLRERHAAPVAARDGADQARRIGMDRPLERIGDGAGLDDAAGIHHGDAVGEAGDHREVVGDPDHAPCRSRSQSF